MANDYISQVTLPNNVTYDINDTTKLPLSGGTMTGALKFSGNNSRALTWEDGTWYQRILTTDDSTADTAVFTFQQTSNSGSSWTDLFTIKDNGTVVATTFNGNLTGNVTGNVSGTALNVTGTVAVANGGTGVTSADEIFATYGIEYIIGTQTAKTGSWTGATKSPALYTGKTIAYKLPQDPNGNASLNLTFPDNTTTGAIAIYTNTSRVTTHYGKNSVIILTYDGTYWRASEYWNSNSRDPGYGKITPGAASTATTALTANTTQITAGTYNEALTITPGNKWISLAGAQGASNGGDIFYIGHALSGVTAGTSSPNIAQTPGFSSTFNIPTITVDEAGHVTTMGTATVQIPSLGTGATDAMAGNTNVNNVLQDAITYTDYTNWRPLIWGNSNSGTEGFTPGDTTAGVFTAASLTCQPSTGTIRAMNLRLVGASTSAISYTEGTNTKTMISFIKGDANGHGIKIGGGAVTVVGAGESAQSISPSATAEHLFLLADNTIYVEAKADTLANRLGFAVDTNGAIVPVKAESANNNAQDIGTSSNKWKNIYATTFTGALTGNVTGNVTGNCSGSSGSCTGNAATASKVAAKLDTATIAYLLGTSTSITGTAANVELIGDTGVYLTSIAGELSAVRHAYNISGTTKAYTTFNSTDNSIDFIFA